MIRRTPAAASGTADDPVFFPDAPSFGGWLAKNHTRESELWVGFHKTKSATKGIRWSEAVDEAIAHGWIDAVRYSIDEHTWKIRFVPRKPKSIWSAVNIRKANALIEAGRMTAAGRAAFEAREEGRSKVYSYEEKSKALDPATKKRLAANPKARAFFDAQAPSYQRAASHWVMGAKKEGTREARLAKLIACSAAGEKLPHLSKWAKKG